MTQRLGRRGFLQVGAATAAGLGLARGATAGEPSATRPDQVAEAARDVPVVDTTDVLVCGAGPAGVAAAIAAARTGASVRLIEAHGQLGGIWTTGLLAWIIDAGNKGGVMRQLVERLDARAALLGEPPWSRQGSMPCDVEQLKLVLEQWCLETGVKIRLHTRAVAAVKAGRRLTHCITESKSGREAFAAKAFVDCSGDGDLAALAGCGFDFGRPAEGPGSASPDRVGETQPFSLLMLVTGIDPQATADFHKRTGRPRDAAKDSLLAEFRRAGVEPSYGRPSIFRIPLRALIAKDADGLLLAGRCISGDFLAHSSYRVTGNAVALGEAAGATAALAVRQNCLPQDVPWDDVASILT